MEGEGEGSHRFTDISATTYCVLVYGMTGDEESCPVIGRVPDYITAVSFSPPTLPHQWLLFMLSLRAGVGVGVGLGVSVTSLLFLIIIVIFKLLIERHRKRKGEVFCLGVRYPLFSIIIGLEATTKKMPMERNMAYELHRPPPRPHQKKPTPITPDYQDLKMDTA